MKIKNLNNNQYKPNFWETFKLTNFPEFSSPPFGEDFPVAPNFKYSTLLPGKDKDFNILGKSEGLFKKKENEAEGKPVAIFPIIEKAKDQSNKNSPTYLANKSNGSDKKILFTDKNEVEKEPEVHNPLIRRLPKVQKRSNSNGVEIDDNQVSFIS